MRVSETFRNQFVSLTAYLFVFLFVYAAISKLLEFESFQMQLGQSPVLGFYAIFLSYTVPSIELIIAFLLILKSYRNIALLGCFSLMILFTTYIFITLYFSDFVPCSCGGILESMSWEIHLVFNLFFVIVSFIAVLFSKLKLSTQRFYFSKWKVISFAFSFPVVIVIYLFLDSNHQLQNNNPFLRKFPHHPIKLMNGIELPYNSYYLAGVSGSTVYLGNVTAPAHVLTCSMDDFELKQLNLILNPSDSFIYHSPKIKIYGEDVFLYDGTVPVLFKGTLNTNKFDRPLIPPFHFINLETDFKGSFLSSSLNPQKKQIEIQYSIIDSFSWKKYSKIEFDITNENPFISDGHLVYNHQLSKYIYMYYYQNKIVLISSDFSHIEKMKTIDSSKVSMPKIFKSNNQNTYKIIEKPFVLQNTAATYGSYLFVKSERIGLFEPKEMLSQACIIDVYNIENKHYLFSFYLYDFKKERIKSFLVSEDKLIGITNKYLVFYEIDTSLFSRKIYRPVSGEDRKPVKE